MAGVDCDIFFINLKSVLCQMLNMGADDMWMFPWLILINDSTSETFLTMWGTCSRYMALFGKVLPINGFRWYSHIDATRQSFLGIWCRNLLGSVWIFPRTAAYTPWGMWSRVSELFCLIIHGFPLTSRTKSTFVWRKSSNKKKTINWCQGHAPET